MKINNHNKSNLNTTNNSAVDLWFWYRSKYLIFVNKLINKYMVDQSNEYICLEFCLIYELRIVTYFINSYSNLK